MPRTRPGLPGWQRAHTPLLYWCVSSVHIRWHAEPAPPRERAISGPTHSAARGACAQVRSPRAAALRPPPPRAPAPARPTVAHTRGRAPRRWSCPRAPPVWPLCPGSGRTSPACSTGTRHRSMKPQAGLFGPLRAPPRRRRQVRVHNCQARPQPPPPGSQRHVTTGAAEGQSRLGGRGLGAGRGGAGRARSPSFSPAWMLGRGRPPGSVTMAATSSSFGHRPGLQFLSPLSLQRTLAPGPPRGRAEGTASGPPALAF